MQALKAIQTLEALQSAAGGIDQQVKWFLGHINTAYASFAPDFTLLIDDQVSYRP